MLARVRIYRKTILRSLTKIKRNYNMKKMIAMLLALSLLLCVMLVSCTDNQQSGDGEKQTETNNNTNDNGNKKPEQFESQFPIIETPPSN